MTINFGLEGIKFKTMQSSVTLNARRSLQIGFLLNFFPGFAKGESLCEGEFHIAPAPNFKDSGLRKTIQIVIKDNDKINLESQRILNFPRINLDH